MAAILHRVEQSRLIDSNGIADSASIYFYLTGTSTLAPIYSDGALQSPRSNPVVVGAGAAVPNIYLDSAVEYRRVIVYLDGTTDEADPYLAGNTFFPAGTGAVERSIQDKLSETVSAADFGAVGDNATDDTAAILAALAEVDARGGGTVTLIAGLTYKTTSQITVPAGVRFNMNEARIRAVLISNSDAGVRLLTNSIVENGHVSVESTTPTSLQAGAHAAIRVGNLTSDGGTPTSPSVGENPSGWIIRNMITDTDKWNGTAGAAAIQVYGGASNGLIEGITVPNSTKMFGAIMLDWSHLGPMNSSGTLENMNTNKTNFNAGTSYTTHPNNITIRNIDIGDLTAPATGAVDVGSFGIRLSGCYNILVENVTIDSVTYAALTHTAGDLGFEFAPTAEKHFACKNIVFRNVAVKNGSTAQLIFTDSLADNVQTAVGDGYVSLIDPIHTTNIVFENVVGKGPGAGANYGIRTQRQRGGTIRRCDVSYYKQGINVDDGTSSLNIEKVRCHFNREHGIFINHTTNPPKDIIVRDVDCHDNGQDTAGFSSSAGLCIGGSYRVTVEGGRFGRDGAYDPTQQVGIWVNTSMGFVPVDTVIRDPHLRSARSADGYGIVLLGSADYNKVGLFVNPRYEAAYLLIKYAGLDCVPVSKDVSPDGKVTTRYKQVGSAGKAGLTAIQGDVFEVTDVAAGGIGIMMAVSDGDASTAGRLKSIVVSA